MKTHKWGVKKVSLPIVGLFILTMLRHRSDHLIFQQKKLCVTLCGTLCHSAFENRRSADLTFTRYQYEKSHYLFTHDRTGFDNF